MPHILPEQSADTTAPTASPPRNCSVLDYLYSPNSYLPSLLFIFSYA